MQNHASRMVFEQENQIRIINSFGLDSVLQLNIDTNGEIMCDKLPLMIRSVCKIDHFNTELQDDKHAILDKKFLPFDRTLERLVRMNQRFKVRQYHLESALKQREKYREMVLKRDQKLGTHDSDKIVSKNDGIEDELDMMRGETQEIKNKILHQQLNIVDYSQSWKEQDS